MSRGEYGPPVDGPPIGNGARLPQGRHRNAEIFYERVNELDAAIQQADHDYAVYSSRGQGFDPTEFVHKYWLPFIHAWSAARPALLAGKIDRAATSNLASWADRYNELWLSATGSWGFRTSAPNVFFRGDMIGAELPADKTSWWKKAAGIGAVLGVGYLALVRPRIKAGERRLAEARQLAADVGLHYGMSDEEKDQAFDAYYKRKGYPSHLLSTAPKFTR